MSYRIFLLRRAQKELSKVPDEDYHRIKESILKLSDNPRPKGCSKLTDREGWRIRVGNYRVIYEIDDQEKTLTYLLRDAPSKTP
ncbi:MAG TPA: type II toxin-antitoxin system RelE/ParE family toxin [Desulfobacterales bacterium]|nr:type II toxin-antitoxin system RelE/ParE family toxin [Desulfobacterales bacterium]